VRDKAKEPRNNPASPFPIVPRRGRRQVTVDRSSWTPFTQQIPNQTASLEKNSPRVQEKKRKLETIQEKNEHRRSQTTGAQQRWGEPFFCVQGRPPRRCEEMAAAAAGEKERPSAQLPLSRRVVRTASASCGLTTAALALEACTAGPNI